jgi:hypothetical protein
MFGDGPYFGENGDEIVVAIPSGNDVKMQMICDSSSSSRAEITADIEPIWRKASFQD